MKDLLGHGRQIKESIPPHPKWKTHDFTRIACRCTDEQGYLRDTCMTQSTHYYGWQLTKNAKYGLWIVVFASTLMNK